VAEHNCSALSRSAKAAGERAGRIGSGGSRHHRVRLKTQPRSASRAGAADKPSEFKAGRELNPRHADFQPAFGGLGCLPLMQQNRPLPRHTKAQSWHTQSELVTPPSQLALVTRDAPRSLTLVKQLWFLGHNLAVFPNVIGVPCIRATSRAVRAARRIPRPTPAAKLSGFFGDFRRVVMVHALADSVWIRNSHILPNDPPAADTH